MSLALLKAFLYKKAVEKDLQAVKEAENCEGPRTLNLIFRSSDKICRICCENGDIPIFVKVAGKTIAEDINKCSDITVFPSDGMPRFLCDSCHELLQNAVKFRKICLESVAKLRKVRIQQKEAYVPLNPKVEVPLELDFPESDSDCADGVASPLPRAASPLTLDDGAGPEDFFSNSVVPNCITCRQDFADIADYRNHLPECNSALLKSKPSRAKRQKLCKDSRGSFLCEICGRTLSQYGSYIIHKSTHSNIFPYKCDRCPYKGKTKDLLKTHMRSHQPEKPFVCEFCSFACNNASNLAKHRRLHQPKNPQQCPQCGKTFGHKQQLTRHIADIHSDSRPVDCDVCGKRFLRRKGLVKHRLKQHKLRSPRGGRLPAYLLEPAAESEPPRPFVPPSPPLPSPLPSHAHLAQHATRVEQ